MPLESTAWNCFQMPSPRRDWTVDSQPDEAAIIDHFNVAAHELAEDSIRDCERLGGESVARLVKILKRCETCKGRCPGIVRCPFRFV
jgi:hypothetical protein